MDETKIIVLFEGYALTMDHKNIKANCTCTLIKGPKTVIVDTMTAWDGDKLKQALKSNGLKCGDIDYVVCTHGHSDHIGCNYLFYNAVLIVGQTVSKRDVHFHHDFSLNDYLITANIKLIATPGHTYDDVSVVVENSNGVTVITGDLFEKEEDLDDDTIWKTLSECEQVQEENRLKILKIADYIIPGHGPMFKNKFRNQFQQDMTRGWILNTYCHQIITRVMLTKSGLTQLIHIYK